MNSNIQLVIDAAKEDMERNWAYGSGFAALKEHCRRLIVLLEEACNELEEDDGARVKMRDILVRTANALKGAPADLFMHSWHDLPEKSSALIAALTLATEFIREEGAMASLSDEEWRKKIVAQLDAVIITAPVFSSERPTNENAPGGNP